MYTFFAGRMNSATKTVVTLLKNPYLELHLNLQVRLRDVVVFLGFRVCRGCRAEAFWGLGALGGFRVLRAAGFQFNLVVFFSFLHCFNIEPPDCAQSRAWLNGIPSLGYWAQSPCWTELAVLRAQGLLGFRVFTMPQQGSIYIYHI